MPRVTVVIPTLHAGGRLAACLEALQAQSFEDFDIIVIDNSGAGLAAEFGKLPRVRVIANSENRGFGEAVNQAIRQTRAEWIATLNDDAYPRLRWLEALLAAAGSGAGVTMCASQIRLRSDPDRLDSAGLAIYGDGTTKQRGHGLLASTYAEREEVLLPSGCAGLYRRDAIENVGLFDADYFLYGEDSDLGLRLHLAGGRCLYAPEAVVEHDYSGSAGRASALKAFYVERNRLYTVFKTFPAWLWPVTCMQALWRYIMHAWAALEGNGLAAEFSRGEEKPWRLVLIVVSAHRDALAALPDLLEKRRLVRRSAVLGDWAFWKLLRSHAITARQVAFQ